MELSTLNRTLLFDTYGDMLTDKQRLCFDLRYNQDLSLGEIAQVMGVSWVRLPSWKASADRLSGTISSAPKHCFRIWSRKSAP